MMPTNQRHKPILTRKQKVFADKLLENPTASLVSAAREAYPNVTDGTARMIASENLTKPNILAYLDQHTTEAEATVVEVMTHARARMKSGELNAAQFAKVALDASDSLLDRLHGKATQRIEQHTQVVSISIDLTQEPDQTQTS